MNRRRNPVRRSHSPGVILLPLALFPAAGVGIANQNPSVDRISGPVSCAPMMPAPDTATVAFLRFYFSTREGMQKLGEASPGGAGRNRTLGLKKLEDLQVPVPSIERQHWFDCLQTMAREARAIRASTAKDVDALIPAMLHDFFNATSAD